MMQSEVCGAGAQAQQILRADTFLPLLLPWLSDARLQDSFPSTVK